MNASAQVMEGTVRSRVAAARRIVIKMGTNVIMRDDGAPAVGLLYGIVESAVNVLRSGRQVLFVSSGAIGLGAKSLRLEKSPSELALKQACAAVGQGRLMSIYEDAFRHFNVTTAQVLLTEDDFLNPERYSNLRATLDTLLQLGVPPNQRDAAGHLPLFAAIEGNHVDTVRALVAGHADTSLKSSDGESATDLATELGYDSIVQILAPSQPPQAPSGPTRPPHPE